MLRCRCSCSALALVCTAVILQTCFTWTTATDDRDNQVSIDQGIMEALQTSDSDGRMNFPGIVRVELDMLFSDEQWRNMIREQDTSGSSSTRKRRKAVRDQALRWSNAEVPYSLAGSFDGSHLEILSQAFAEYHKYTCIRFRPTRKNDANYVRILDYGGCASWVGCVGGAQEVHLRPPSCMTKQIVIHELGHAIGLVHEQSRPDRDNFVSIRKSNILPMFEDDFKKRSRWYVDDRNIPYDYLSIMHYGENLASKNLSQPVIETKNVSYQKIIGKTNVLSFRDIKLVNLMYNCSDRARCPRKIRCPGDGFVGQDCKCYCPSPFYLGEQLTYMNGKSTELCSECMDYDEHCTYFRQRGFCSHRLFSAYLSFRCPRACDKCRVPQPP